MTCANKQIQNRSEQISNGRLLDDKPDYHCIICSRHITNQPLPDISRRLGRTLYGHVTCRCVMERGIYCPEHKPVQKKKRRGKA